MDGLKHGRKNQALNEQEYIAEKISVTRGNNTTVEYQVVSTKIYPYNDVNMNQVLSPIATGRDGLNLMTCTGNVISGTSEFSERLVVFAEQS